VSIRDRELEHKRRGAAAQPAMLCVYTGRRCSGFIIARGKLGHEAFDRDENSLGIFASMKAAAAAVAKAAS
jgi:hypothetical protein